MVAVFYSAKEFLKQVLHDAAKVLTQSSLLRAENSRMCQQRQVTGNVGIGIGTKTNGVLRPSPTPAFVVG